MSLVTDETGKGWESEGEGGWSVEILEETLKGTLQYLDCIICDRVQIHLMLTESSNHTKKKFNVLFFQASTKKGTGPTGGQFQFWYPEWC